jgi:hypothetical protein
VSLSIQKQTPTQHMEEFQAISFSFEGTWEDVHITLSTCCPQRKSTISGLRPKLLPIPWQHPIQYTGGTSAVPPRGPPRVLRRDRQIWDSETIMSFKRHEKSQLWWLIPLISATWEAEIRRIVFQGQPGQKVSETPSQLIGQAWWLPVPQGAQFL